MIGTYSAVRETAIVHEKHEKHEKALGFHQKQLRLFVPTQGAAIKILL
jgi:hypothetical protein